MPKKKATAAASKGSMSLTKRVRRSNIVPVTSVRNGFNRCDDFPPVQFNFVYKTPPERTVHHHRYNNTHYRLPYINGFDVCDRVLIVEGDYEGKTAVVNNAGRKLPDNTNILVVLDDEPPGDLLELFISPAHCRIIPYPQDEEMQRIKYYGRSYMMLEHIDGVPVVSMQN